MAVLVSEQKFYSWRRSLVSRHRVLDDLVCGMVAATMTSGNWAVTMTTTTPAFDSLVTWPLVSWSRCASSVFCIWRPSWRHTRRYIRLAATGTDAVSVYWLPDTSILCVLPIMSYFSHCSSYLGLPTITIHSVSTPPLRFSDVSPNG